MTGSRRDFLKLAGLAGGGLALAGCTPPPPHPPPPRTLPLDLRGRSVVFVVADDMRFDFRTSMDVFATGSWVDCTSATAQTPICGPSRASLLTGKYAKRTGVLGNSLCDRLDDRDTIATRLSAAGYRTALVGKYLNDYPWGRGSSYVPPGWTDWAANGSRGQARNGLDQVDYCFEWASDFVRRSSAAQPFLLWVAPTIPHEPYDHPRRYDRVQPPLPPMAPSVNEADVSDKRPDIRTAPLLSKTQLAELPTIRTRIGRGMLALDDGMKKLMAALDAAGRLDDTIVIFTSDNGWMLGEHRLLEVKNQPFEESARVPFVAYVPGVPRRIEAAPISLVDVPVTVCRIARTSAPGSDGVDVSATLTAGQVARPGTYVTPARGSWEAVRTSRHKYVEYGDGFRELYDLATDPYELQNIAGRADQAVIRAKLASTLDSLRP